MTIDLGPEELRRLEEIARKAKKPPEEMAKEILAEALSERGRTGEPSEEEAIRRQREAWERLHQKISNLPVAIKDGFSSRDHDQVLYGGKKA